MGTWRTLHPRRISHAPGAISVHGSVFHTSLEPGPSGPQMAILPTGPPRPQLPLCWLVGWLVGFNFELQLYSGLLPTV